MAGERRSRVVVACSMCITSSLSSVHAMLLYMPCVCSGAAVANIETTFLEAITTVRSQAALHP
jgi:hypothetical protein